MSPLIGSPLRERLVAQASKLFQNAFVCRRCVHQQQRSQHISRSIRQTPFLTAFKTPGHYRMRHISNTTPPRSAPATPIKPSGSVTPLSSSRAKPSSFPTTTSKSVAYWLLASAGSVFGIVVFGGLTRLTESGLSITEWRPVTGSLPPRNEQVWEEEFARYKLSPEFIMLNSRMDLQDFKSIYWMEWTHRLWGRLVGITFLLPTIYFIARRRVSKPMAARLVGICGLIGFQGFLGWWMVKSGLKDDLLETGAHPRVSQYRLAAHLGTAFLAYLAMLHNGLRILRAHALLSDPPAAARLLASLQHPHLLPFRRALAALAILVFTTAMSGALVAGLDAGLIYNDFPWMGQGLLPPTPELLDPFYSRDTNRSDLLWRNMLENPVLVQLDHRLLATSTFTAVLALFAYARLSPRVRGLLPKPARAAVLGLVHLVSLQVLLGITTLWYLVPTPLAAAHQAGALALLSGVVVLGSRVWVPRRTARLLKSTLESARRSPAAARGVRLAHRHPDAMLAAKIGA